MEGLVKGDVVVIDFPYSNLKDIKRRPVMILKIPKGGDIIALQITSSSYESSLEINLRNSEFKKGTLKRDSFIRIDKIASIEKSLIKYKVGSLKQDKFNDIIDKVCLYLKN